MAPVLASLRIMDNVGALNDEFGTLDDVLDNFDDFDGVTNTILCKVPSAYIIVFHFVLISSYWQNCIFSIGKCKVSSAVLEYS